MLGRALVVATAVNANPVLIFSSSLSSVARREQDFSPAGAGRQRGGSGHAGHGASQPPDSPTRCPGWCGMKPPGPPRAPQVPAPGFSGLRKAYLGYMGWDCTQGGSPRAPAAFWGRICFSRICFWVGSTWVRLGRVRAASPGHCSAGAELWRASAGREKNASDTGSEHQHLSVTSARSCRVQARVLLPSKGPAPCAAALQPPLPAPRLGAGSAGDNLSKN